MRGSCKSSQFKVEVMNSTINRKKVAGLNDPRGLCYSTPAPKAPDIIGYAH